MRLLDASDVRERLGDLPENAEVVVEGDTNGDACADIAAVFVDRPLDSRNASVGVFHGIALGHTADPTWIIEDSDDTIADVSIPAGPGVTAMVCYDCDFALRYFWSGEGYETGI